MSGPLPYAELAGQVGDQLVELTDGLGVLYRAGSVVVLPRVEPAFP
ncbi:hypothetical protein K1W54_15735 [Micromonospora sp. CPCC 205371]|nr:hypothetical protein [Micromonospora sp. CPCC 205371]